MFRFYNNQRFEYTPYGKTWIHHDSSWLNESSFFGRPLDVSYRFTGKERDEETGYTYFGARYLDVRRGLWTQTDPALGEYIPTAGTQADKLPGMGGVYNLVNAQLYHYAGNNPVKYTDPDGESIFGLGSKTEIMAYSDFSKVYDNLNALVYKNEKKDFWHSLLSGLLTIGGLIPSPAQVAAGTLSTADGLFSFISSFNPDIQKRALKQMDSIFKAIADYTMENGTSPSVEISITTTRTAEEAFVPGVAPAYSRTHITLTDKSVISVSINGATPTKIPMEPVVTDMGYYYIPIHPDKLPHLGED